MNTNADIDTVKENDKKEPVKKVVKKKPVKNSTKPKRNVNGKRKTTVFTRVLTCIFMVCIVSLILYLSHQSIQQIKQNKQLSYELKSTSNELVKSKARIAGVKGQDDLLKRDIELYIRSNYRKVPKVIAQRIASIVVDLSKKEEVSPELLIGIIQVESQFNPMAVGPKTKYGNARGLMQIMPAWAKKFELESLYDLHDVDINIVSGVRVFKIHLKENKGSISKGLYHYVNKDKAYVDKVYNAMGRFVSFRSTIDDNEKSEEEHIESINNEPTIINGNGVKEKEIEKESEPDKTTEKSS
jgi:hypothetical protein